MLILSVSLVRSRSKSLAKSDLANVFTPVPVTNSQARQLLSGIAVITSFMVYYFVLLLLSMTQMRISEKSSARKSSEIEDD